MQWAALVGWLMTAVGGLVLFMQWERGGGLKQKEGIRAARLLSHMALAIIGLAVWVTYLATHEENIAWTAVAILAAVAILGVSMLMISLKGRTTTARTETPAEAMFPIPIVFAHGALGITTLLLSALSAAGIAS
jgi:predicted membrane-bound mannosyltransferase